ncbi:MAG TPA: protein phosphatase 2C domain-containing protein [Nocardioides sp.]|nr:protein phosphatase 2C domain-containing protein [Nocardioides sp.]
MTCPACGTQVPEAVRFCETCGAEVGVSTGSTTGGPTADDRTPLEVAPISAPTRRPADALPDPAEPAGRRPCASCGGEVGPDYYCTVCGTKAPSERDHFEETPAAWVAGVCDRGVVHERNEDAMALLAAPEPGSRAVLIVLDGVSSSVDSDVASLAGAKAAREVLRRPLPSGMGTAQSREAAVARTFGDAVTAANTAIVATTDPDSPNPASATFVCAIVEGGRLYVANVGDSRAYWLPDGGEGVQLSVDDSMAQVQMTAGVPREQAESSPQAHAITKWLGRDSSDITPRIGQLDVTEPGWLVVCSDGLWNYASSPAELATQLGAAGTREPLALASALVGFATTCGGHDNITVAVARLEQAGTPAGDDEGAGHDG